MPTTKEYMREWRKKNPERVAAAGQRYREKNREKAKESSRQWRARNLLRSRESALRWARANPERRLENCRRWRKQNPERMRLNGRKSDLKNKYGITLTDYDAMSVTQGGLCAVCGAKPERERGLHVDHNHNTGRIRGLLCSACNTACGLLKENPSVIRQLARYIEGVPAKVHGKTYKLEPAG